MTRHAFEGAVAELLANERQLEPARDAEGRPLRSLLALLRPDPPGALSALNAAARWDTWNLLPLNLHRTVATLFAMGVTVSAATG